MLLAAAGPSPLWYLTRGTGLVCLILLTAVVAMGVVTTSRWQRPGWPRFVSVGLHRNLSLLVVVFLAIHIITAELDIFAPVGWLAVLVPFASAYRPVWLGLGTVAFDLLLAITATSLLRVRVGLRVWRGVHWLAYLCWPVALLHGLGTGTDARLGWVQALYLICLAVVVLAAGWRLYTGVEQPGARLAGGTAAGLALVAIAVWSLEGPLSPGWSKRAGTPTNLLAASRVAANTTPNRAAVAPSQSQATGFPGLPFDATLTGSVSQHGPDSSGQVEITIDTRVAGAMSGALVIILHGEASGGGVSLASSTVTFGPASDPSAYHGHIVLLSGDQLVATVSNGSGSRIQLGLSLQIDPSTGSVQGDLRAGTVSGSSQEPSSGDGAADGPG